MMIGGGKDCLDELVEVEDFIDFFDCFEGDECGFFVELC